MEKYCEIITAESPFPFLKVLEHLADTPRRGWELRNVPLPESVSDHMYQMAFMCWMMPEVDEQTRKKAVYMALVHDAPEAIAGDTTPSDNISRGMPIMSFYDEKHIREDLGLEYLKILLAPFNQAAADEVDALWQEFEAGETEVAKWVKDMDILQRAHRAMIYEEQTGRIKDFEVFRVELEERIKHPKTKPWAARLLKDWAARRANRNIDMTIVFVSGGPGVGKGTQCAKAAQEFDFVHISAGDLLREEAKSETSPYRDFINKSIQHSVIIPAQLTTLLLQKRMNVARAEGKTRFLLDGFPRSVEQAVEFEKVYNRNVTLLFTCSIEAMQQRLEKRAQSSGRIDDNPASVIKRLKTFEENNKLVIEHLQQGGPIWTIQCDGSIDEVYASVQTAMQEILRKPSNLHEDEARDGIRSL
ncbi:cytidylate kinase [Xylogone sp. PMI_703]|nr:cytidylate kinase [Xylogone sp. PMI_703]